MLFPLFSWLKQYYMPILNPMEFPAATQEVKYSQIHRDALCASKLIIGMKGWGGRQTDLGNQARDVHNTIGKRNTIMVHIEIN